jgi:Cobalamin biosynthesis protein CobN and related Mg-chelatases
MKVAALIWSAFYGMLTKAAAETGFDEYKIFSSKNLETEEAKQECLQALREAEAVFVYSSSTDNFWDEFVEPLREIGRTKPVVWLAYDKEIWRRSSVDFEAVRTAHAYFSFGGPENAKNLLQFIAALASGNTADVPPPLRLPWEGLWHPAAPEAFFVDVNEYLIWHEGYSIKRGLNRGTVGVLIHRHFWVNEITEVEKTLIQALESEGLRVICAFSQSLRDVTLGIKDSVQWMREVFLYEGGCRVETLVKLQSISSGDGEGVPGFIGDDSPAKNSVRLFREMHIPIFQPLFSHGKSIAEWENDPQGLGAEASWSLIMPEFEGTIEPHYIGGQEPASAATGGLEIRRAHPERIAHLAARVANWVDLSRIPTAERKVAFILHNSPCASVEATVGSASKLDSLESLAVILRRMREAGYQVEPPDSGEALIQRIMEHKAISEFRWTTVQEIVGKGGALTQLPVEMYRQWFDDYPEQIRERLVETWGKPPGEMKDEVPAAMVLDDTIIITGVTLGPGAVACVQPKRGCAGSRCDGRVCKILHDPEIPPPHQYLATYRWLQEPEGFGAHLIVHVGTHGNLEFLPGKSVGLSVSCLPDLALHQVPHVYIYNADNSAEGIVAKRRSYAELVDHLQATLVSGGLYGDLAGLADLLGQWARSGDNPARRGQLEALILEAAQKLNLTETLKPYLDGDFSELVPQIHETLSLVANTQVEEGMHVFGSRPEGTQAAKFIYSILRFESADQVSLRSLLAQTRGYELADLLLQPGQLVEAAGKSKGELAGLLDQDGIDICRHALDGLDFSEAFRRMAGDVVTVDEERLKILAARFDNIRQRLEATREISSLLAVMNVEYILPGPSGLITRGREDVLPTGRNFYSQDPRRLPTQAAWGVGVDLARALLDRHLADEGCYPENVAMFWMCSDLISADGEGLAQMMALLGVKLCWSPNGLVSGFDIIPLEELGRPRIDLTIRVSGILRDIFPHAVDILDRAVQAVAALEEHPEQNFVRKHTLECLPEGAASSDQDWRRATFRIFGARPGTYHSGVDLAVLASAWEKGENLAWIFVHCNGYAYGQGVFGQAAPTALEAALATVDVTYNKTITDEYDLLGCSCYFGTHGGLAAAAGHFSKGKIRNYYGDTREQKAVAVRGLDDEIRRVVRAKLLNPQWIEGMKKHGYKGAGDISKRVGNVFGWEASTQEVDDWIFDDIARTFMLNEDNRAFFEKHNPWALEEISRRLLEAESRGLWQADAEVLQDLKAAYLNLEGVLEEHTEVFGGEMQGGSVDIIGLNDLEHWKEKIRAFRAGDTKL